MGKDVLSKIRANDVYKALVRVLDEYGAKYEPEDRRPHPVLIISYVGLEKEYKFPSTPRPRVNLKRYTSDLRRFLQAMQYEALEIERQPVVPSKVGQVHVPMQGSLEFSPQQIKADDTMITMSSREIAELVGSRHDKVKQSIERLADRGVIGLPPLGDYLDSLGRKATEYRVGKRDSYVIVAQLSPEFTARLVDRWQELEEGVAYSTSLPDFTNPAEAARSWADQFERASTLEATVAAQQPKVTFYDSFAEKEGLYTLQNAGRIITGRPNKFIQELKRKHLFYQHGDLVPYVRYRAQGLFDVKVEVYGDRARSKTFITPKGLQYFSEIFKPNGMIA